MFTIHARLHKTSCQLGVYTQDDVRGASRVNIGMWLHHPEHACIRHTPSWHEVLWSSFATAVQWQCRAARSTAARGPAALRQPAMQCMAKFLWSNLSAIMFAKWRFLYLWESLRICAAWGEFFPNKGWKSNNNHNQFHFEWNVSIFTTIVWIYNEFNVI